MYKKIVSVSTLLVGLLLAVPANASVVYTSSASTISLTQCPDFTSPCTTQSQSESGASSFSATLSDSNSTVSQQSQFTDNSISVTLSAVKNGLDLDSTSFKVDFTLSTATNVTFSGSNDYFPNSSASGIALTGPTGFGMDDVLCEENGPYNLCLYSNNNVTPPPHSTQSLAAGAYELDLTASASGPNYGGGDDVGGYANFTLSFAPSPVPIPAAGWLLGSALGGLSWLARRRKTPSL